MHHFLKLLQKFASIFSCLIILTVISCQTNQTKISVPQIKTEYSGCCSQSYNSSYSPPKIGYYPAPPSLKTYSLKALPSNQEILKVFSGSQPKPKQKRNIVFFMIDAARKDYINKDNTPHLYQFMQEQDVFPMQNIYSNSVTTYFSTLTFFFGLYGHARPYLIEEERYDQGALNLKVLKQNGYRLSLFARPNNYFCFDNKAKISTNQFENSKFLFSKHPKKFIDGYCTRYSAGKNLKSQIYADLDHDSVSRFKKKLPDLLEKEKDGHVFLFFLDGAHTPYSYSQKAYEKGKITLNKPYLSHVRSEVAFENQDDQIKIKNSYINALKSADYQFKRMIDELKRNNIYDKTDIIVFSDHGERMFEKHHMSQDRNKTSHSGTPYNELIRPVTILKLAKPSSEQASLLKSLETKYFSQKDIFPTLFDFWKIDFPRELDKFVVGKNLFKEPVEDSQVSYSPNWDKPTFFAFINQKIGLKLIVKFYRPQYKTGKGAFDIIHIFDLNDVPLKTEELNEKVGFTVRNKDDEQKILITYFRNALASIVDL